jgi:hypothetical protein
MKNKFLWNVAVALVLAACSDDSSTESITNKASSIKSSCKFDDSWFGDANEAKSLKKMVYSESGDEREPERSFYVEDLGDSVLVSLTGLVDACNKMVRDIEVRMEGDTLYATLNYVPDVGAKCLCFWVDMSFTVAKKFEKAKTLVIGKEIFPLREEDSEPADSPSVDVPGKDSVATEGKAVFKGSSCEFDESQFENAVASKSLKKTTSEDKYGEGGPERNFYVEDAGNSVEVFVSGLVSACNKVIRGVDVHVQGGTLFATVNYRPDTETLCLCSWVDMSFTVDKGLLDDSVKTLVIGEEVFTLREEEQAVADSAVTEPVLPQN